MGRMTGRNKNTNDVASVAEVTINSVTATTIAIENPDRLFFEADIESGNVDVIVYLRLYAASVDNTKKGIVLTRKVSSNDGFFRVNWSMPPDNIYTGEISAISETGTFNLYVTEY